MDGTLDLGDRLSRFVEEQVQSGRYRDASEVVRAGLTMLERSAARREEELADFRASIDEAMASGAAQEIDFEALRAEARRRLSAATAPPVDGR